jgi:hypothetical protein
VAEPFRIHWDQGAIEGLADGADAAALALDAAWGIALDARTRAVRASGEGAESIQPWPGRDRQGPFADVAWDREHFYMSFHEFGTQHLPARPALGPALDRYLHL